MGRPRALLLVPALLSSGFVVTSLEFAASSAIAQTIVEYPAPGLSIWFSPSVHGFAKGANE